MKKQYIIPETELIHVETEQLLNANTGVPNQDQDDDGGRAKGNTFAQQDNYWDDKTKGLWDD